MMKHKDRRIQDASTSEQSGSHIDGHSFPFKTYRGRVLPFFVLAICVLFVLVAWNITRHENRQRVQDRFDFRADQIEAQIRNRLLSYEHMLRGGIGLFKSSTEVTREEWRLYVETLHINQHYPGVQGLGYAVAFPASQKEAHIAKIRESGFPDYTVYPERYRPEYTAIVYLEPFDWRNQRAFGYDMFSESTRHEAMVRARDTGRVAMTGKVILVQEDGQAVQPGFLIYLPLYEGGKDPLTVEERRKKLRGYIYCPFRMYDFMQGILADQNDYVEISVYDGEILNEDSMLYNGHEDKDREHLFVHRVRFEFGEHVWTLVFRSSAYFDDRADLNKANLVLILGILISLLFSGMIFFLGKMRRQTEGLAEMTEDLRLANLRLKREADGRKKAEEVLKNRAQELDDFNAAMIGRESRVIELKEEVNNLCRKQGSPPVYPAVWGKDEASKDSGADESPDENGSR
jgi:CHASE1-domain containing sensor protein